MRALDLPLSRERHWGVRLGMGHAMVLAGQLPFKRNMEVEVSPAPEGYAW